MPKEGISPANADFDAPQQPSIECLKSTKSPPPDFITQMSDYYYHHYIGQVRDFICPLISRMRSNL